MSEKALGLQQIFSQALELDSPIDRWIPDSARPLPVGDYEHLHNVFLQYASERGLPTLMVFLWLIAKILWDFAGALRRKMAEYWG